MNLYRAATTVLLIGAANLGNAAQSVAAMTSSDELSKSFGWPDVLLRTLASARGASLRQSLLFCSNGTDSDFTGGAGSWEHAASMVDAASTRVFPDAGPLSLAPRTICEACLAEPTMFCCLVQSPYFNERVGSCTLVLLLPALCFDHCGPTSEHFKKLSCLTVACVGFPFGEESFDF